MQKKKLSTSYSYNPAIHRAFMSLECLAFLTINDVIYALKRFLQKLQLVIELYNFVIAITSKCNKSCDWVSLEAVRRKFDKTTIKKDRFNSLKCKEFLSEMM